MAAHRNRYPVRIVFLTVFLLLAGCAVLFEKPMPRLTTPLTLVGENEVPSFLDDLDPSSLEAAVECSLQYYRRFPAATHRFGNRRVGSDEMRESLLLFLDIVRQPDAPYAARVTLVEPLGHQQLAWLDARGHTLAALLPAGQPCMPGDAVRFAIDAAQASLFDADSGDRL